MANTDRANGFTPSRHLKGGIIRASEKLIASGLAENIFSGDVVKLNTTGLISLAGITDTNLIGIFAGVEWTATDGEFKYSRFWPTGTATKGAANAKAYVYDDPEIAFAVQTKSGTAFTQAMVGANVDHAQEHAGSTTTGQSGEEIEIASPAPVATTAQFRVLGLIPRADNELAEHADIEVMFVETLMRPAGTIGI